MIISDIVPTAKKITSEYDLCDSCLGRLFTNQLHLSSCKLLGKKIKSKLKMNSKQCYICKNLFENLDTYQKLMLERSSAYEYSSFSVGAILKPSIIDRDDIIRSKFKLRGIDGIKTEFTKELSKRFQRKTKKNLDHLSPDITLTINIKDEICEIHSKPIIIQGRYNKHSRNLPQKQKPCPNCSGKGCRQCTFHGMLEFNSIEGYFSEFLFRKFGGTLAKYTWIGGEDKTSKVLGSGRPFFVKLHNPNRRKLSFPREVRKASVIFLNLKILKNLPKMPISFHSVIQLVVVSEKPLDTKSLRNLKGISKNPIVVYENSGKRSEKSIFSIHYKKLTNKSLQLTIDVEGGLPVKRFVNGDNVNPNVSQKLGSYCKCEQFDFLDVIINDNN